MRNTSLDFFYPSLRFENEIVGHTKILYYYQTLIFQKAEEQTLLVERFLSMI